MQHFVDIASVSKLLGIFSLKISGKNTIRSLHVEHGELKVYPVSGHPPSFGRHMSLSTTNKIPTNDFPFVSYIPLSFLLFVSFVGRRLCLKPKDEKAYIQTKKEKKRKDKDPSKKFCGQIQAKHTDDCCQNQRITQFDVWATSWLVMT